MATKSIEENLGNDPLNTKVGAPDITPDDISAVYTDLYEKVGDGEDAISTTRKQFIDVLKNAYGTPQALEAPTEQILGKVIKASTQLGVVDDVTAGFSRNLRRLKGDRLKDGDVSEVLAQYGISLPPISGIDFSGDTDGESEKLDGWNAKAKAIYNLNARLKAPELLAYRDEVFQQLDDSTKYLKRKVGATDSETIDFLGRLVEGTATTLDTLGFDSKAEFLRSHVATNPDWDESTSAIVGQAIGQVASFAAGAWGVGEVALAAGASTLVAGGAQAAFGALSAFHGTAKERYDRTLAETGNAQLADEATNTLGFYAEASIDTASNILLAGTKLPVTAKFAKLLRESPAKARDAISKSLGETTLGAAVKKSPNLVKAAEIAGDAVLEGGTEAAQGAIQDWDLGNVTNEPDKYKPFDLEQRANDFLGGAAGGAFVGTARVFSPQIKKATSPITDRLASLASPVTTRVNTAVGAVRDTVSEAVDNIQTQAQGVIDSAILKVEPVIADAAEYLGSAVVGATSASPMESAGKVYTAMRDRLGSLINHPRVQQAADGMMSMYNNFSSRETVAPKPAVTPEESAAGPVTDTVPVDEEIAAATQDISEKAGIVPSASQELSTLVDNVSPSDDSTDEYATGVMDDILEALPDLSTDQDGYININQFAKDEKYFLAEANLVEERQGKSGSYVAVDSQKLFNLRDERRKGFKITNAITVPPVDEATLPKYSRERTGTIKDLKLDPGTAADDVAKTPIPLPVAHEALGDNAGGKNVFSKLDEAYTSGKKADNEQSQAAYNDTQKYFNSQESQNDLESAGLEPDRAAEYRRRYNNIVKGNVKPNQERRAVNRLRYELLNELSPRPAFETAVSKLDPKNQKKILKAFPKLTLVESKKTRDRILPASTLTSANVSEDFKRSIVDRTFRKAGKTLEPKQLDIYLANTEGTNTLVDLALEKIDSPADESDALRKLDIFDETSQPSVVERADVTDVSKVRTAADPLIASNRTLLNQTADQAEADGDLVRAEKFRKEARSYNIGAQLPNGKDTLSPFQMKRVYDNLGIDVHVKDLSDKSSLLQPTGEAVGRNTVSLENRTINSTDQAGLTLGHELGEVALKESLDLSKNLDAVAAESKKASDDSRVTKTNDVNEHKSDLIHQYLYNPASVSDQAKAILEKSTLVRKMRKALAKEQGTPLRVALAEEGKKLADIQIKSRDAALARNENGFSPRERIAKATLEIRTALFNSAAPLYDAVTRLAKANPLYKPLAETLKYYENQFKNRAQIGGSAGISLLHWYKNAFVPAKINLDEFNSYLTSNKILNQRSFWEKAFASDPTQQAGVIAALQAIPESAKLLTPDVMANLTGTSNQFVNGLNEVIVRLYAEGTGNIVESQIPAGQTFTEALKAAISIPTHVRGNLQNYNLETREVSEENINRIMDALTPEQQAIVKDGSDRIATLFQSLAKQAFDSGRIGKETLDFIQSNPDSYSTTQLADAVTEDPYVSGAFREQGGNKEAPAPPFETSILKMLSMGSSTARYNFQNTIGDVMYALASRGGPAIRPVAKTGNIWFTNSGRDGSKVEPLEIDKFYAKAKELQAENPDKSYLVTAEGGQFVLHESDAGYLNDILNPKSRASQSEALRALNATQILARNILTRFSLPFAALSALRLSNKLNSIRGMNSKDKFTVFGMFKDTMAAPMMGFPFIERERNTIVTAWRQAGYYINNQNNADARYNAILNPILPTDTLQTIMARPDFAFALEAQGDLGTPLLSDISAGLDPADLQAAGQGSQNSVDLDSLTTGKKAKLSVVDRLNQSNLTPTAAKTALRYLQTYGDFVTNLNNRLELTEKLAGIRAYVEQGETLPSAFVKANIYFGNPDPRGGGSWKPLLNPFIMFATPALNDMRNLAEIYTEGFGKGDPRLLKMATVGVRNALMNHPAVWGAGAYVLAKAMLGSDDEAKNQAEIIQKLMQNIPEAARSTGNTIPLGFRNPRTGEWIYPSNIKSLADLDPSMETAYLQFPIDRTSAFTTGLIGNLLNNIGSMAPGELAGNLINSAFRSAAPSPGPVLQGFTTAYQAALGENPIDWFTGKNIATDAQFKRGGTDLALQYVDYLIHNFAPVSTYSNKPEDNKTRIAEPFGWNVLNEPGKFLKLGILKSSNYGSVQNLDNESGSNKLAVREAQHTDVADKLLRYNELTRVVQQKKNEARDAQMAAGVAPSSVRLKATDYMPAGLLPEFMALKVWRDGPYKLLTEQAEMERRQNGDSVHYRELLKDIRDSVSAATP